jgi:hypothetical protein
MYIGGSFGYLERPGYPGQGLAHITPNGGIDFTFRSDCWETIAEGPYAGQRIPGVVHTLALDNGILYVGGSFSSIGGGSRQNLAAIDTRTNTLTLTAWNRNTGVQAGNNGNAYYAENYGKILPAA